MTSPLPVESPGPTWILNSHSVHVKEPQADIANISDEFGLQVRIVVTRCRDDISSLVARLVSENHQPVVAG